MASKSEDVKSLSLVELRKRLDQQKRLLQNKALLNGLPDGGERVRRKVAELESAIASKHGLEETMEQLSRMHLGEDRGPVEGRKTAKGRQCLQEGMRDEGGQGEGRGGTGEGKKDNGQRRKFVDLQAALGGWGQSLDSDDEDETTHIDSKHLSTVKDPDELPVHNGAKSSLGMGPIEDVSCATHNKTDQERLAAVRQRIQQDTPRRVQTLSIDESLKLQMEQHRREEELRTEIAAARLMETVGTMSIGMPPRARRGEYRNPAVSSVKKEDVEEEGEEDGDSVSDPSDLSSGDDLVGEEIHF